MAEPSYPYSLAKKQCTEWVKLYSSIFGVPSYTLKLFNVYGESSRKGAVYLFSNAALHDGNITLYGDGSHVRDFIHVSDLVRFVRLIVKGEIEPGTYECGTGAGTTVKQLIRVVEQVTGITLKIEHNPFVVEEAEQLHADRPNLPEMITLEEGVKRVVTALRNGET